MRWVVIGWTLWLFTACDMSPTPAGLVDTTPEVDTTVVDTTPVPDTAPPMDAGLPDTVVSVDTNFADTGPLADLVNPPPFWPINASLKAEALDATTVRLSWPLAVDDASVAHYRVFRDGAEVAQVGGAQTSLDVTGLEIGVTYAFSVRAYDPAGAASIPLLVDAGTADSKAPHWPLNAQVKVSDIEDTSVRLAWSPAADDVGVTGYQIRADNTVLATTEEPTVIVTGLEPWTPYTFTVRAMDAAGGVSVNDPTVSFQTTDSVAPQWAEGAAITVSDVAPHQATLTWPQASDEGGVVAYDVVRDKVVWATVDGVTTSYTVQGLVPEEPAAFSIRAHDVAGNVSSTGPQVTVSTGDETAPLWPQGASLIASNLSAYGLTLAWTPATDNVGVSAYRIFQDGEEVMSVAGTTTELAGLQPWSDYTFSVRAEDGAGNLSLVGPSTSIKTQDSVVPWWEPGALLTATDATPTSVTLSWDAAQDDVAVTGYRLTQGTETVVDLPAETTTYTVQTLSPWSVYAFRVQAVDAAGNWSTTGPFAALQAPDESPPTWNQGQLWATQVTEHTLTLHWLGAEDDVAVAGYRITMDGAEIAVVDAEVPYLAVAGLSPWTDYSFSVQAVDPSGQWSTTGPTLTVKTDDTVAPTWPENASLMATNVEPFSVTLSWPAATDDVAVTAYHIALDGNQVLVVDGGVTTQSVTGLTPLSSQTLSIVAFDAAANPSTVLSVTVDTPDDCYDDLQQFVEEIWQPFMTSDCIACHIEGGQASSSQLVLEFGNTPDVHASNFETLKNLALDKSMGDSLLLLKPTGQVPHGGGQRLVEGTDIYNSFLELIARAEEPGGCEDPSSKYTCDNLPINPGPSHLRRLTSTQYHNTILDLFGGLIDPGTDFPQTVIHGGFSSYLAPNLVSAAGAQSIFDAAEAIGVQVPEHLGTIVQCGNQPELPCIADFIKTFGLKVFRRPLTQGELTALFAAYQKAPYGAPFAEKVARLIEVFLQSPQFLYIHAEEGAPVEAQPGVVALSHYAMASRLSYFLWDSMPDQVLFNRAAAGDLNTPTAITEEVTRMLSDPRAQQMVARFHDEWLHIYKLEEATKDPAVYPEFTPGLATAMQHETELLVKHVVFEGDSLLSTLLTTTSSFVNQELGALYGIDISNLAAGEFGPVELGPERPGILTRAGFNAAHAYAHNSSPIHRGHFFLEGLLCQKLVIPPVDIGELPEVPQGTIRDRLEQHRVDPVCGSCHDRLDPLGLAFENYDGIGKWRDTYANGLPVDATGVMENPTLNFTDAPDLMGQLVGVDLVAHCYTKQWFRYASGRGDLPQDKCSIKSAQTAFLANGGNIIGLIHAITQSDSFRYRWHYQEEANNE